MTMQIQPLEALQKTFVEDTTNRLLFDSHLSWQIEERPLSFDWNGQNILTNRKALVRSDNGSMLGDFTNNYACYQNREVVQLAVSVASLLGKTVSPDMIRSRKGGALLEIMIPIAEHEISANVQNRNVGDLVSTNLRIVDGRDGNVGFGIGLSHRVLSCTNGMTMQKKGFSYRLKHTYNVKNRVMGIIEKLPKLAETNNQFLLDYDNLGKKAITEQAIKQSLQLFLDVKDVEKDLSPQMITKIDKIRQCVSEEVEQKGKTLNALLNGFSRFTTHYTNGKETATISVDYGQVGKRFTRVFEFLNSYASDAVLV